MTTTSAQIAANRTNAALSTGPTSAAGKAISSKNALKTGLTGRTVLLPGDDVAAYESMLNGLISSYHPATPEERELVQSLADTRWRLDRVMNIEYGIFVKGSLEFNEQFAHLDPAAHRQMVQLETFLKYEKSMRNLTIQEGRLHRHMTKTMAELHRLKLERHDRELAMRKAAQAQSVATPPPPAPPQIGSEFSNEFRAMPAAPKTAPTTTTDNPLEAAA